MVSSLLVSDEKVGKDLGHVDDPTGVVDEDRRQPTFDVRFVDDGLQVVKHRPEGEGFASHQRGSHFCLHPIVSLSLATSCSTLRTRRKAKVENYW